MSPYISPDPYEPDYTVYVSWRAILRGWYARRVKAPIRDYAGLVWRESSREKLDERTEDGKVTAALWRIIERNRHGRTRIREAWQLTTEGMEREIRATFTSAAAQEQFDKSSPLAKALMREGAEAAIAAVREANRTLFIQKEDAPNE